MISSLLSIEKLKKLFGGIITHPNSYPIDNHGNYHNSVNRYHSPIIVCQKDDCVKHEQNSPRGNKPPCKLLMPLHISSLVAYDDILACIKWLKNIKLGK
jgi:hypothetical protein